MKTAEAKNLGLQIKKINKLFEKWSSVNYEGGVLCMSKWEFHQALAEHNNKVIKLIDKVIMHTFPLSNEIDVRVINVLDEIKKKIK